MRGFASPVFGSSREPGDPQDGLLDAMVLPKSGGLIDSVRSRLIGSTLIPVKRLTVKGKESFEAYVDTVKTNATEMVIEVAPARLKVITGRERLFGSA